MNRMLLTAAAALSMAVSSHAMAASYVIDHFNDELYFDAQAALMQADSGFGSFDRDASYVATTTPSQAYFGDTGYSALQITNDGSANATLTLNYNISSLASGLGSTGNSALSFTVFSADAPGRVTISALLNGQSFGSWTNNAVILTSYAPSWETHSFTFSNSALTGNDQLTFVVSGLDGYDTNIGALSIGNVSPVPEASEWAMMVAGLGVVGAVAGRRRARISA